MRKIALSYQSLLIIGIMMIFISSNLNWGKDHWRGMIQADAKGYYAYLPATFIYKDHAYQFFDQIEREKYYKEHWFYDYRTEVNNKTLNKYFCGTAIMQSPFFLMAHVLANVFGFDQDGYSKIYMIFINLAALFWLLIGLFFLRKILILKKVKDIYISIILMACLFGTNLFYYSVVEPGMSHVYSFSLLSIFYYVANKYFINPEDKLLFLLAGLIGIITLVRPVNVLLLLFLPFMAEDKQRFYTGVKFLLNHKKSLLLSILLFFIVLSIQGWFYFQSTGKWFLQSYNETNFNFLDPHFVDILISYKKGLFLYTPMYLLATIGILFSDRNSFTKISWYLAFVVLSYIFSSWPIWYYGGSFSSRVYVDYLPFFMVPMGTFIHQMTSVRRRVLFISFIVGIIILCQFQTYQYRYELIHWSEMTKEMYWDVFLKLKKDS